MTAADGRSDGPGSSDPTRPGPTRPTLPGSGPALPDPPAAPEPDGLVCVDKPAGCTSHDVVAAVRRLAGTRRVGHAGTLDPAATGVLVLGVGRATRLLPHLDLNEKAYQATIRLGVSTLTDDAEGEVTGGSSAAGVSDAQVAAGLAELTGEIEQVPAAVSAVKVGGERAYRRARRGQQGRLAPRRVTVWRLRPTRLVRHGDLLDVDVDVVCSSGTYVRALARDLGARLGVGGHLTALRRTRVGRFDLDACRSLDQLAARFEVLPMGRVAALFFPCREVDAATARLVRHGQRLPGLVAATGPVAPGPVALLGPDAQLLALYRQFPDDPPGTARPVAVFAA